MTRRQSRRRPVSSPASRPLLNEEETDANTNTVQA
jgi:hypothetical protein